ncbi:MAG: aldo/keto reductase [Burkholderiales bacterium]|nr:aldo/keto reductase [Burkholderiales bacterium]
MKIAIGTAQFGLNYGIANTTGSKPTIAEIKKIVKVASTNNIDTYDTAIAYGDSESVLGTLNLRDKKIITKLPALPNDVTNPYDWVLNEVNGSLDRLNGCSIYGLLLHRPEQLFQRGGDEILRALSDLKERNIVNKIGVSIYDADELENLFKLKDFDIIQAPFNIIDNKLFKSGWLHTLNKKNVEVHTRSAFLQGLLLMPPDNRPSYFDKWSGIWRVWTEWLNDNRLTALEACVSYAMSIKEIDKVIFGIDSAQQLMGILSARNTITPQKLPEWPHNVDSALTNPANWIVK